MSGYRLAPAAAADLEDIWLYSARTWSEAQAERYIDALAASFDTIAAMPEIGREHREFSPAIRIHPSGQHVILYRIEAEGISIYRVLGGRRNWRALPDLDG
ncbi:type II toxin-antitoxin system RelE/ParE family toxin [Mangrovicoccus ximenensis]|uniref:type II toxin-antitoxin system RelE/ParE family toxin n=1 Tax=Mangrovicoccus ximenensis TaxID=1911570 RepID=UPI000D3350B5|nr:type II toxin-antitoxin system RelE/ParE family toxin [Mangrovicoccus ximenensis]